VRRQVNAGTLRSERISHPQGYVVRVYIPEGQASREQVAEVPKEVQARQLVSREHARATCGGGRAFRGGALEIVLLGALVWIGHVGFGGVVQGATST
jgi:hypothetical protein